MSVQQRIADAYVKRAVQILRYSAFLERQLRPYLYDLEDKLVALIARYDPTSVTRRDARERRLSELLKAVNEATGNAYARVERAMSTELRRLSRRESEFVANAINIPLGVDAVDSDSAADDAAEIVAAGLMIGRPLSEHWRGVRDDTAGNIRASLRMGVVDGQPMPALIQGVRGTSTGRQIMYTDVETGQKRSRSTYVAGSMTAALTALSVLSATAVHATVANTRRRVYSDNKQLIRGIQQVSMLDTKTSKTCIAYAGAAWDHELKPIGAKKLAYNGGVPRHPRCRSDEIPLIFGVRHLPASIVRGMTTDVRDALDGSLVPDISFEPWLRVQSSAVQDEVLGPARAKLWRAGRLSLSQLVDQRGRPLSLEQLGV